MKWPSPMACSCPGHRRPGVMHARPCCDEPHITQEQWDILHPVPSPIVFPDEPAP